MAKLGFDLNTVEDSEFVATPIPEGWYTAEIAKSDSKDTQTGGHMLSLGFRILGPTHAGRWVWQNYNIVNSNENVQNNARQAVKAIAVLTAGHTNVSDTTEMHGKPLMIEIRTGKDKDGNDRSEPSGFASGYRAASEVTLTLPQQTSGFAPPPAAPPATQSAPPQQPPSAPPSDGRPSWHTGG